MPYEEFEHHDFESDTLDAQPSGSTRYNDTLSWLVKAEGPGGDLSKCVTVASDTGKYSYLLFPHSGSGDDLHNYPDRIVACVKVDTSKGGGFAVGFNLNTSALTGFVGACFRGTTFSLVKITNHANDEWSQSFYSNNYGVLDSDTWYVVDIHFHYSGYMLAAQIYDLEDPEKTIIASCEYTIPGYSSYSNYTGNPHPCLLHGYEAAGKCCWLYASTYEEFGEEGYPPVPEEEENTGDGVVEWNFDHDQGFLRLNNDWEIQSPDDSQAWVTKETHDFTADTVGQAPILCHTPDSFTEWLVTADGPTSALTNCAHVDDSGGSGSQIDFDHKYSDPDLGDVSCDALVLVKISKRNNASRFRFYVQKTETYSIYLEADTYGNTAKLYRNQGGIYLIASQTFLFDETKWYCMRFRYDRYNDFCGVRIWEYGYAQPNTWLLTWGTSSDIVGNPHITLQTAGAAMEAWCAWTSVTNNLNADGLEVPDPPPDPTGYPPILGECAFSFEFGMYAGHNYGSVDFPEFTIGETNTGYADIRIEEGDWVSVAGRWGWTAEVDFPEPEVVANGGPARTGIVEIDFPEASIESFAGGRSSIDFPDAEIESSGHLESRGTVTIEFSPASIEATGHHDYRGSAAISFPSAIILASGGQSGAGDVDIDFPSFVLRAEGFSDNPGEASISLPAFVIAASGHEVSEGGVAFAFPEFDIESWDEDACLWHVLRHERYPVDE